MFGEGLNAPFGQLDAIAKEFEQAKWVIELMVRF